MVLLIFWLSSLGGQIEIESLYPGDVRMWDRLMNAEGNFEFESEPQGVILPHHLAVGEDLARFYRGLAKVKDSERIFILGPDHYEAGAMTISSCGDCVYKTVYGEVEVEAPDLDFVGIEGDIFAKEHGIFAHTPFIKYFFPEAVIVPLIIRSDVREEDMEKLREWLNENLRKDDLLLASIDFSHYKPVEEANVDDQFSFEAIVGFDLEMVAVAAMDSPASVSVILEIMQERGYTKAVRLAHTNTQDFYKARLEETTSHQFFAFYLP